MNRKRIFLSLLPLGFLGMLLWRLSAVSAQLPSRMAVHFGLDGNPNGWQSPETFAVTAALVFLAINAVFFWRACKVANDSLHNLLLGLQWLVSGSLFWILWKVIGYNLNPTPVPVWPIVAIPVGLVSIGLMFGVRNQARQKRLLAEAGGVPHLIAEEHHRSLKQLWFVGVPAIVPGVLLFVPNPAARGIGALVLALLIMAGIFIYRGFLYRVTSLGVEVRGFGLLLGFVPKGEIRSYDVEPCRPLMDFGGWGVRYTGTGKAYIWGGNKVVRIRTRTGEVMLGHFQPERLVGDLDRMMQAV